MGLSVAARAHTTAANAAQVQGAVQIGLITLALCNWSMADAPEDDSRSDPAADPPHGAGWTSRDLSSFAERNGEGQNRREWTRRCPPLFGFHVTGTISATIIIFIACDSCFLWRGCSLTERDCETVRAIQLPRCTIQYSTCNSPVSTRSDLSQEAKNESHSAVVCTVRWTE